MRRWDGHQFLAETRRFGHSFARCALLSRPQSNLLLYSAPLCYADDHRTMQVLHTLSEKIELTAPYIPSFLSMREAPFLVALINRLRSDSFQPFPQVFFIDGNGRFHDRSAGLATVVGVLAGVPTVGTAKEYQPLREALQYGEEAKWRASQKAFKARCKIVLRRRADWLGLHKSDIPDYAGAVSRPISLYIDKPAEMEDLPFPQAVLTSPRSDSTKPLFVSPGHRVSLRTAVALTLACCTEARVPEAVRQADALSRHVVKETWDG